nr:MAG TPA: hypothetical protein [Caudoviricetes sp.]
MVLLMPSCKLCLKNLSLERSYISSEVKEK